MRYAILLILAITVSACSGDGGGTVSPSELRLRKLRGDNQRAQVAATAPAVPAGVSAQVSDPDLLPQQLVARIVLPTSASRGGVTASGPSFAALPPNTTVQWEASEGCGRAFVGVTIPNDSGDVSNFWRKGTRAGECRMRLQLIANGQPITADSFSATFDPGPYEGGYSYGRSGTDDPAVIPAEILRDAHGNPIPFRFVVPEGQHALAVTIPEGAHGSVAARSISWNKAAVQAAGGNAREVILHMQLANGQTAARMSFIAYPLTADYFYELKRPY